MIGIDTNVLVRLFAGDDAVQGMAAAAWLDGLPPEGTAVVNIVVIVELVWTLERAYKFERRWIEIALERLTRHPRIHMPDLDVVREAVHRSRETRCGIADSLIAVLNRSHGCRHTMTFDRDATRDADFVLLPS